MRTLLILLLFAPLWGCSQDLGFWEGTPEQLDGCKNWRVRPTNESIPIAFFMTVTDCYGNEYQKAFTANGQDQFICSMTEPTGGGALVVSVTQTGNCTDPVGSLFDFWIEGGGAIAAPNELISEITIYSSDAGGANRNQVYTTTNTSAIVGENNSAPVNDSFGGQAYYVLRVRARKNGSIGGDAHLYIRPGTSQSITLTNSSFEYKELVFEKREFYLQMYQ